MAGFGLNDTIGMMVRVLQNINEIRDLWHRVSALLQKIGLLPAGAVPALATHAFNVEWLQESLNAVDNAGLDVDGVYGTATFQAVKKYQSKKKLDPDGWFGLLTMAELEKDTGALQGRL